VGESLSAYSELTHTAMLESRYVPSKSGCKAQAGAEHTKKLPQLQQETFTSTSERMKIESKHLWNF